MRPIPLHAPDDADPAGEGAPAEPAAPAATPLAEFARESERFVDPSIFRGQAGEAHRGRWPRLRPYRGFLAIVVAPTLLLSAFLYGVVADQYESEAHFVVRGAQQSGGSASGLGQLLGLNVNSTAAENHSIVDYLLSHDAVDAVGHKMNLAAMFRRPEADIFSRLRSERPQREELLRFYREMVHVSFDGESGITILSVRGFRPEDSEALAQALLALGEARVNSFNQRALVDGLAAARAQLNEAESQVAVLQGQVTGFRERRGDADPERTAGAQIGLVAQLQGQLAQARAQMASMAGAISRSSPQYVAMARQVSALEAQVGAAQGRLAGGSGSVANSLGSYEGLKLRQEFAAKRYEAAAAALEASRDQALRQQLYVVRVVEPNLPEKSLYPKRLKLIGTVLAALLLLYGIGWLILAGVREHAA